MNQTLTLNPPFSIQYPLTFNWKLYLKLFWILSFTSLFALLVFYIFQINAMTRLNFLVSNYEQKIISISEENQNLAISFSRYVDLENIEQLAKNLNFEKPEKIHYIKILESTVMAK